MATSLVTALAGFRAAFLAMAQDVLAGTGALVTLGHPGVRMTDFDDLVSIAGVESRQEPATLSSNRSREETLDLTVWVSCHRRGDAIDLEQECNDRVVELLGALEYAVRQTDTTLGGVVRDCFLTGATIDGLIDPKLLAVGRTVEAECTFTAHVRVTGTN